MGLFKRGKNSSNEKPRLVTDYTRNIDEAIALLMEYRDRGESVCYDFNGHMLYSDGITVDGAYVTVTGKTKKEYEESNRKSMNSWREKQENKKKNLQARKPEWTKKVSTLIYPEKMADWEQSCEDEFQTDYDDSSVDSTLKLMYELRDGISFQEVKKHMDEAGFSDFDIGYAIRTIRDVAVLGPEFYVHLNPDTIFPVERIIKLRVLMDKNAKLEEIHPTGVDSTREDVQNAREIICSQYDLVKKRYMALERNLKDKSQSFEQEYIDRGRKIVWAEKADAWEQLVKESLSNDSESGLDNDILAFVLHFMELVSDGHSFQEMKELFGKMTEGSLYHTMMIGRILLRFMPEREGFPDGPGFISECRIPIDEAIIERQNEEDNGIYRKRNEQRESAIKLDDLRNEKPNEP